jgi:hypothetical protein
MRFSSGNCRSPPAAASGLASSKPAGDSSRRSLMDLDEGRGQWQPCRVLAKQSYEIKIHKEYKLVVYDNDIF